MKLVRLVTLSVRLRRKRRWKRRKLPPMQHSSDHLLRMQGLITNPDSINREKLEKRNKTETLALMKPRELKKAALRTLDSCSFSKTMTSRRAVRTSPLRNQIELREKHPLRSSQSSTL